MNVDMHGNLTASLNGAEESLNKFGHTFCENSYPDRCFEIHRHYDVNDNS